MTSFKNNMQKGLQGWHTWILYAQQQVHQRFASVLGTWISNHPSADGAQCTKFNKESAKTCWILTWSPYTARDFSPSGLSWINCKFHFLSNNITWLTTASMTLPSKNSAFSSSSELVQKQTENFLSLVISTLEVQMQK